MIWPEPEAFYFFFRSRSTLKNWDGAGAGIKLVWFQALAVFKNFVKKNNDFSYYLVS